MHTATALHQSTIGKKAIMAVTGLVWFGFVVGHMAGHLIVFLGPESYNAYAKALQGNAPLLWGTRVVLLSSVALHLWAALSLTATSNAARPVGYGVKRDIATTYAAKTMKLSGPILFAFLLYHLAHFTAPGVAMGAYVHEHGNVYGNFVHAFAIPWVTATYVLAMSLLGLHLYHGSWSLLRSLGVSHPRYDARTRALAQGFAWLVVTGFLLPPLAVQLGFVK